MLDALPEIKVPHNYLRPELVLKFGIEKDDCQHVGENRNKDRYHPHYVDSLVQVTRVFCTKLAYANEGIYEGTCTDSLES